ncbi:MAG: glycosyltransferase family 39 protein [Defluviitaleaceae bacterium]|nr:glycosyltransferase family 39 protein [Defluviitaleaceae bacterium]
MKILNVQITKSLVVFTCISVLICVILFVFARSRFWASTGEYQHWTQSALYQNLHGFYLLDNHTIQSYHADPWIMVGVDTHVIGNRLAIHISNLNVASTSAQIFFMQEDEGFSELNSRRFVLTNGINIIELPLSQYTAFRLDLTEQPNIMMTVNEVNFLNYARIPVASLPFEFWVIFITLSLFSVIILHLILCKYDVFVKCIDYISENKYLFIYLLFCFFMYSLWAIVTPFNGAPDEHMRWDLVRYMIENGSLPRGDDPAIRDAIWGFNYSFFPFTTQIIGAVFYRVSSVFSPHPHVSLYLVRLPSILSSVGTVFFTFKIGKILFTEKTAWFLIILVSMWPQFALVSSYINNDAFGIFTISIILYAWILGIKNNWNTKSCIWLAIGVGLCLLSYYNAFTFILLSAPLWFWVVLANKKNHKHYKVFVKRIVIMLLIVLSIAGWFYIRNAYLYDGDFLGMRTQFMNIEAYAVDWLRPSNRDNFMNRGLSVFDMLRETPWIPFSYLSFIATFGYMNINPHASVYALYHVIIITGVIGLIVSIFKNLRKNVDNKYKIFFIASAISIPITIGLSIHYSFSAGFQPQGRYLLPMLLPLCILLVLGLDSIRKIIPSKYDLFTNVSIQFIQGLILLMNVFSWFSIFAFYHLP